MNSHQRVAQTLSGSRSDKRQQSNRSWDENVPRPSINSQSRLLLRSLDMEDAVGATRKCFFMPAERRKPTGLRTKSAPSKCHRIARGESFRKSAIASRGSSWSASKACAAAVSTRSISDHGLMGYFSGSGCFVADSRPESAASKQKPATCLPSKPVAHPSRLHHSLRTFAASNRVRKSRQNRRTRGCNFQSCA